MSEYIEREAAIAMYEDDEIDMGALKVPVPVIVQNIKDVPAADVRPVVHGKWIVSRTDYGWNGAEFPTHCKCDQCGREVPYLDKDNYCPNCGALMDKDGDGDV